MGGPQSPREATAAPQCRCSAPGSRSDLWGCSSDAGGSDSLRHRLWTSCPGNVVLVTGGIRMRERRPGEKGQADPTGAVPPGHRPRSPAVPKAVPAKRAEPGSAGLVSDGTPAARRGPSTRSARYPHSSGVGRAEAKRRPAPLPPPGTVCTRRPGERNAPSSAMACFSTARDSPAVLPGRRLASAQSAPPSAAGRGRSGRGAGARCAQTAWS